MKNLPPLGKRENGGVTSHLCCAPLAFDFSRSTLTPKRKDAETQNNFWFSLRLCAFRVLA
jgi:hypothetical protein